MNNTYNGYTNFETWNASLWIGNSEFLYNTAKACVTYCETSDTPYDAFVRCMNNSERFATGDGVKWNDPLINYDEMNEMMNELVN